LIRLNLQLTETNHRWLYLSIFFLFLMSLSVGCNIGPPPPPTPGPFPVEGIRQITSDFAFYRDLTWSPAGSFIAARRCPVMDFKPRCFGNEDTILLIDPDDGTTQTLDLLSIKSNMTRSYPTLWSPNGDQLLLLIVERINEDETGTVKYKSSYISYDLNTTDFTEVDIIGTAIGWNRDGTKLFIKRIIDEDLVAFGWLSIMSGDFKEEVRFIDEDHMLGYYVLSPDQRLMLRSNSSLPENCDDFQSYRIGSEEGFSPFLSLACFPAWSSDGSKLAYAAKDHPQSSPSRIIITNADGSNPQQLFSNELPYGLSSPTWSPDGSKIAFTYGSKGNANAIYIVDVPEHLQPTSE